MATNEQVIARGIDEEPIENNRRCFSGSLLSVINGIAFIFAAFHVLALNGISISDLTQKIINLPFLPNLPMETWSYRIVHICGALILGFVLFHGSAFLSDDSKQSKRHSFLSYIAYIGCGIALYSLIQTFLMQWYIVGGIQRINAAWEMYHYGYPLLFATLFGISLSWFEKSWRNRIPVCDILLCICAISAASYLLIIYNTPLRMSTGTSFAPIGISFAAASGMLLILEITRRVAGLAVVFIAVIFLIYVFIGPYLPGFLGYPGLNVARFFSRIYTDAGILGPTTAVSSTYIILFIIFAAFLQASKVGDYFVNFAFAIAGRARGGPAKVAIFASGLMGMINGTSAGNVVATGSLTIPLMKKVGYPKKSSGAVEAAASTGGQIMPPIMGAGAFIMAEITGIPYAEIAVAALIPAILYFLSIYCMVDFEAARLGMRGLRSAELPLFSKMVKQAYLFIPITILIFALFSGYSVIRAGTLATVSAAVVSWLTPNRMGIRAIFRAFELAGEMSVQIIAVCACAGIIVGVISLTGVGARFSSLLLGLAEASQLLALVFAMLISILLGMGMPTTAAYAVAASVVAPGLIEIGIMPLTAHFFVFYFAVVSAITPPVALASYAAAGISGANPLETSLTSFKIGLTAFIVPFMFFYNSALLMEGSWFDIGQALITACVGVFLLSASVQAWFLGLKAVWYIRIILMLAALFMIEGGWITDLIGISLVTLSGFIQKLFKPQVGLIIPTRGAD